MRVIDNNVVCAYRAAGCIVCGNGVESARYIRIVELIRTGEAVRRKSERGSLLTVNYGRIVRGENNKLLCNDNVNGNVKVRIVAVL